MGFSSFWRFFMKILMGFESFFREFNGGVEVLEMTKSLRKNIKKYSFMLKIKFSWSIFGYSEIFEGQVYVYKISCSPASS